MDGRQQAKEGVVLVLVVQLLLLLLVNRGAGEGGGCGAGGAGRAATDACRGIFVERPRTPVKNLCSSGAVVQRQGPTDGKASQPRPPLNTQ